MLRTFGKGPRSRLEWRFALSVSCASASEATSCTTRVRASPFRSVPSLYNVRPLREMKALTCTWPCETLRQDLT